MNLIEFLKKTKIEELGLPAPIIQKLQAQNLTDFQKIYTCLQTYRAFGKCSIEGLCTEEMQVLNQKYTDLMVSNGLMKPPLASPRNTVSVQTPSRPASPRSTAINKPRSALTPTPGTTGSRPIHHHTTLQSEKTEYQPAQQSQQLSPLAIWETKLAPQLHKVELIGEINVSKEDLEDIALNFCRLLYNRNDADVLNAIEHYYPVTFLVFMVGQGVHGYDCGDFWLSYEKVLHRPIDTSAFGHLFEKLVRKFGKQAFRDLQEQARRYVDPILAHGGIPVYCLKDFFNNIVVNSAIRPELLALDNEELIDEIIKKTTYTANTDKPVLHFLEYGGATAINFLDRSRKMLLAWQQSQVLLSPEDAGLPAHITEFFAVWTKENSSLSLERGPKSRLMRPKLSLDPWGLGVFLELPTQPVSAFNIHDLQWQIQAGEYEETIKTRSQRRGDQVETREVTLRLNTVPEKILVRFIQGESEVEWTITGYSPDHRILSFDPVSGHMQNHVMARETWLLYPDRLSLSIQSGEGAMIETLPELPGEWAHFRLECWDLSKTVRLGLCENGAFLRDIYIRHQEKIEPPTLLGGTIIPTNLEENPIPVYAGLPPILKIPLGRSEDIQAELSRWQLKLTSDGLADPEVSRQWCLSDLTQDECTLIDDAALIHLDTPRLLNKHPAGRYQVVLKGPLGRDALLELQILPECHVSGLRDCYIPDLNQGSEAVSFTVCTSIMDRVESLNGADGIKIEALNPGEHQISVPPEISSVGLMIRRNTVSNQFIRIPLQLRINRLRWRMVYGNGLVENWQQKHLTMTLQGLLQEESPLLIIDFPATQDRGIKFQVNLLDIQGKVIQQLSPADRSAKRANRFWRFDLAKITHIMEINDSPLFRLDLVAIKDGITAFSLPVIGFTRDIDLWNFQSEVYSSKEYHHICINWVEKKQLRSRALVLWSLFRPWQSPLIEMIPDSACGEYEFSIPRTEHTEGIYRVKMVIMDPWAPSAPPPFPPDHNCNDVEIISPEKRLEKLQKDLMTSTSRQATQFSNRIEISLISKHLGKMDAGVYDLKKCCENLIPATSREILTLQTILSQAKKTDLEEILGKQIIQPQVITRLCDDMTSGNLSLSEFLSLLKLAPSSKTWPGKTCEALIQVEDPKIRFKALVQLVSKDIRTAVAWIIQLVDQSQLSIDDAVSMLHEEKIGAIQQLKSMENDPTAEELLQLLNRYNPYSGLPIVRIGSWVMTNAGWGRIEEIEDPTTRISVDSFLEDSGKYVLSVLLHIHESPSLEGEKATINMLTGKIIFLRARQVYICKYCQAFATAQKDIFKMHLTVSHGKNLDYPGNNVSEIPLTHLQFNMNPQQDRESIHDLA